MKPVRKFSLLFLFSTLATSAPTFSLERATEYLRTLEETNIGIGVEYLKVITVPIKLPIISKSR